RRVSHTCRTVGAGAEHTAVHRDGTGFAAGVGGQTEPASGTAQPDKEQREGDVESTPSGIDDYRPAREGTDHHTLQGHWQWSVASGPVVPAIPAAGTGYGTRLVSLAGVHEIIPGRS